MNVDGRIPLWGDISEFNKKYLETKVKRSGHFEAEITGYHEKRWLHPLP